MRSAWQNMPHRGHEQARTEGMKMSKFEIVSAQTGNRYGSFIAASVESALDLFAQSIGFTDRRSMWNAGQFEYVDAVSA